MKNNKTEIAGDHEPKIETDVQETGSLLRGTSKRKLSKTTKIIAMALAVAVGLYHVITAYTGIPTAIINRPIHLAVLGSLIFIWYEATHGPPKNHVPWYDWVLVSLTMLSGAYVVYGVEYGGFVDRTVAPTIFDMVFGIITIFVVLEMTRRIAGIILPIISLGFLVYSYTGQIMPGLLAHGGYSIERIITHQYMTTEGIFGIPLGVSATYVVLFIIFGAFLEETGIGNWLIDLTYGFTGKMTGGPAKTSVFASAVMGTLSGAAVANTATTGAFTIPLMKRTGFGKRYAAAVESAASAGGQILPPIMGAGAFIMAVWTGIPYFEIIFAATIPALLYFLCVFLSVHFKAKKEGLEGRQKANLPDSTVMLKKDFLYLFPLVVLVYLLVAGYTPILAGFVAIVTTLIVSIPLSGVISTLNAFRRGEIQKLQTNVRVAIETVVRALDRGIQMTLIVAAACATAGIVVGVVTQTGIGLAFASIVSALSGGVLLLALLITMVTCIILGMGLPTTAAYVVVAALGAPALTQLGIEPLAAHMFIFYFAIFSTVTPPIMLTIFAASAIAESDPWRTAPLAVGIAIVGFIIPFAFVYGNELILIGSTTQTLVGLLTAIIGVISISAATQGYLLSDLGGFYRAILFAMGILLIMPTYLLNVIGIAIFGLIIVIQYANIPKTSGTSELNSQES